jgi:hypothetical protein
MVGNSDELNGSRSQPAAAIRKVSNSLVKSVRKRIRKFAQRQYSIRRHPTIDERPLASGHLLVRIAEEVSVPVFSGKHDQGYHDFGTHWWTNPSCPYALQYLSIDSMYPAPYFEENRGHPSYDNSKTLYEYMQTVYADLFGTRFASVLELGTGGGEITRHFAEANLDFLAIEGTSAGLGRLLALGISEERVLKANLKFLKPLGRRFDIAMCTEVAEHIEPWFASKIASNCTDHADAVWFSAAKGTAAPHYHHINEVPIEAWDNLFANLGYGAHVALNGAFDRADRLYLNAAAAGRVAARAVQ